MVCHVIAEEASPMKSILLPVENHALAESCLETAWQIARRCETQVSA